MSAALQLVSYEGTFVSGVEALLDEILIVGPEDPRVTMTLPTGILLAGLVDRGVFAGEILPCDRHLMFDTLTAWFGGLRTMAALAPDSQPLAVEGFKRLLREGFGPR